MRPRSIAGPLFLIAIGLLFLFRNLWPAIPFFDLFSRYWPFLLILWGVVRLAEVLVWWSTNRPLPVSGVSGGEWTWVVLICVFGSMFFWGSRVSDRWNWGNNRIKVRGLEIFGERFEFPVNAEKQSGRTPRVVLELGRGNAKITTVDSEKVVVTGRKTIQAYNQTDADAGNKDTPIEIVTMGDQVIVRTNQDKLDNTRRASVDLEISVPKGTNFEGRGKFGDFDIRDLLGNVEVNSENAGVRLQNIGGAVKLDLRRSDIIRAVNVKGNFDLKGRGQDVDLDNIEGQVSVAGSYGGELNFRNLAKPLRFEGVHTEMRVEKTPGTIRIALGTITAENVQGPIRLTSKVQDIKLREFTQNVEVNVDRGDIELRPASLQTGRIDARTANGNVDLVLPNGAKFDLTATTRRGEISNDFGQPLRVEQEGRGATLRGSNGGPQITLNSDRGEISVRRLGDLIPAPSRRLPAEAVPPAPPKVPAPVEQ
jgi:DUF4097 and DUF4098 domain-containing protein YvlB